MAITNGYATRDEIKDWIGVKVDDFDLKLDNVVTSVSRWIDQRCQRHFWQATAQARPFDTCDAHVLDLGYFNDVTTITEVATDENRDGTYENVWSASDYQRAPVDALTGAPEPRPYRKLRALGGRTWPQRVCTDRLGLIRVTGTWGWPAVPAAVNQACLIQGHRIFNRPNSPAGMIGFADFGVVRMQGRLDPDVAAMVDPYQLTAVLVA